jgi:chemotaxis protein histidine kinase CheA
MARKTFDELVDEMNTSNQTPSEWSHEAPEDRSKPEQKADEPAPAAEDTPAAEPEPEPTPAEEPPKDEPAPAAEEPPKKDEVMEELDNTNSIIRKRLEKQSKKYEEALAQKDARYEELKKELEELKKSQPKAQPKTRKDFEYDEDYVAYLTRQQIAEADAEKAKAKAEADAEDAKQREAEEAEQASIKQRQNRFLANIDECFEGDEKTEFLKRVQYANSKGLGDLLDSCPMASDYLLGSEKGPLVLQKIMSDADTFRRVFPVKGISPMEQFYTLKEIERQCLADRNKTAEPAPAPVKPTPKLGKPGSQGCGGTMGDPMADPKARRDYVRNLLYGHK